MCCSIIGYCGADGAAPILVQGLKRMEYRGYDSVGVATAHLDGKSTKSHHDDQSGATGTAFDTVGPYTITVRKGTGRVSEVNASVRLDGMPGMAGIGHTRWATHGGVTDTNAHPHLSSSESIAIVHNGIIKNFEEIRDELMQDKYVFRSETDSEVIANLLQKNYDRTGNVKDAMLKTVSRLQGEYAFVAMFEGGRLAAARWREPLILGVGGGGMFLSSDVLGFIEYTDEAVYVENGNIITIDDKNSFEIFDFDGNPAKYDITKVSKEFGDAYKGDYAHYTIKEIYEQHETLVRAGLADKNNITTAVDMISNAGGNIYITGSGSSYNAALVAKHVMSRHAKISSEPVMASEMQFASEGIASGSVLVAISQSGESADVLNAVRIAKDAGCRIISIVNITTSSLVHDSDIAIGMDCGPEIGVAATKSFTSQLVVFYRILSQVIRKGADYSGQDCSCGKDDRDDGIAGISKAILHILNNPTGIQAVAKILKDVSDIYILGRGIHYPIASEAALKIKELTYIHAEGIAGGELKHGPLALMDSSAYVIIINPHDATYEETLTSAREIKARGAKIIGISDVKSDVYDHWICIPGCKEGDAKPDGHYVRDMFYAISEIVPVQLLAYYVALEKDTDPDYPRNLAKSVTVR